MVLDLQKFGKIIYYFDENLCTKIERIAPAGHVKYQHKYFYDQESNLIGEQLIGELGCIEYDTKENPQILTPFERIGFPKESLDNSSNKIDDCMFDSKGNIIQKNRDHYVYDGLDRLVSVSNDELVVYFKYDDFGRRIEKEIERNGEVNKEHYIYWNKHEIGSTSADGELKWLRIPGLSAHPDMLKAVAIETENEVYAPIYDFHWNIVKLVNINNDYEIDTTPDLYGKNLKNLFDCPWIFSSKRYDKETNLVYFGNRFYDPELCSWLTEDPLSQINDLYRYCFYNPKDYIDPDGCFAITIPLFWGGVALSEGLLDALFASGVTYLTYEVASYASNQMQKDKKEDEFKKPKPGVSGKEGAKDLPSWAEGEKPYKNESGKDFAKRLVDERYGPQKHKEGPQSEFNKLKKYGDRAFE